MNLLNVLNTLLLAKEKKIHVEKMNRLHVLTYTMLT
jgi:hypothetical protein